MSTPTEWYQDNFLISTQNSLIQPAAVNAAFATESLYWTRPIEETLLKKMLNNSLCFGVYELPASTSDIAGRNNPRQIGLARLITDEVSFAYLTDVYILEEYRRKGLGTWLVKCVDETLLKWPELRRVLLVTSAGQDLYSKILGMRPFESGKAGMQVMSRSGPGSLFND